MVKQKSRNSALTPRSASSHEEDAPTEPGRGADVKDGAKRAVPRPGRAVKPLPASIPPPPSKPAAAAARLPSLLDDDDEDDDWNDDITLVGQMSEELKALRQGFRELNPFEPAGSPDDHGEIEITEEQDVDALLVEELLNDEPTGPQALILVSGVGRTDRGRKRKGNEDAVLVLEDQQVFAVADGMGGHAAGEIASNLAVTVMADALADGGRVDGEQNVLWPRRGDELARCVEMANRTIYERAKRDRALHGMGTTMTAIRFSPNRKRAYIAHVGDSRCYRIRNGEMQMLTQDHTIGALLGAVGPLAQQLSRAVGVEEHVQVDLIVEEPMDGDLYVMCSDGLNKMLRDHEIREIAAASDDLDQQAQALVDSANARGGRDNITVILIRAINPFKLPSKHHELAQRIRVT